MTRRKEEGPAGLEPAKTILHEFVKSFSMDKPSTTMPTSDSGKNEAYAWIYGSSNYRPLMWRSVMERSPHPMYSKLVHPLFDRWLSLYLDVQNNESYRIPDPLNNEAVSEYLRRLQSIVIVEKERRKIWWLSLRSFVDFLRNEVKCQVEYLGELEAIFPEAMTIYSDTIIRKVPLTLHPVDIWVAADILQNLSRLVLKGRPNAQISAAHALGLAWVCLAIGHASCMTRLDFIYELLVATLRKVESDDPFVPHHWLTVRSYSGKMDIPISAMQYEYLLALPRTNSLYVFDGNLRHLRRSFDRAVTTLSKAQGLGKITFYTFMHRSHEAQGYRFKGYPQ